MSFGVAVLGFEVRLFAFTVGFRVRHGLNDTLVGIALIWHCRAYPRKIPLEKVFLSYSGTCNQVGTLLHDDYFDIFLWRLIYDLCLLF
jgi:hypothetical protein